MEGGWGKGGGITPFNGLHCIRGGSAHLYVSGILMGRNFASLSIVTTTPRVRKQKHLHRSGRFTSSGHVVYYRTTTTSPQGSGNESNKTIPMGVQ